MWAEWRKKTVFLAKNNWPDEAYNVAKFQPGWERFQVVAIQFQLNVAFTVVGQHGDYRFWINFDGFLFKLGGKIVQDAHTIAAFSYAGPETSRNLVDSLEFGCLSWARLFFFLLLLVSSRKQFKWLKNTINGTIHERDFLSFDSNCTRSDSELENATYWEHTPIKWSLCMNLLRCVLLRGIFFGV